MDIWISARLFGQRDFSASCSKIFVLRWFCHFCWHTCRIEWHCSCWWPDSGDISRWWRGPGVHLTLEGSLWQLLALLPFPAVPVPCQTSTYLLAGKMCLLNGHTYSFAFHRSSWVDLFSHRWLYMLIVEMDANFCMMSRLRRLIFKDPSLGPGWAYFVDNGPYTDFIKEYVDMEEVSDWKY